MPPTGPPEQMLEDVAVDEASADGMKSVPEPPELDEKEDQKLRSKLEKANSAESEGDLDVAIESLQEYQQEYKRIKKEKRLRKLIENLNDPEKLFEVLPHMPGFSEKDIISPDDLSEIFPGYEANYDDIEIQSSPEEILQIIQKAQELQEQLGMNFKFVVRPDMTASTMKDMMREKFNDNGWGGVIYSLKGN
jgi:hypothetical protein